MTVKKNEITEKIIAISTTALIENFVSLAENIFLSKSCFTIMDYTTARAEKKPNSNKNAAMTSI